MLQPERGQLKLSMYANSGLLTVHIGQARNLQSKFQERCNAYIKVHLIPESDQETTQCKTVLVKDSNQPAFNEKFSFELLEDDLKKRVLISAWHREPNNGRSEFLGSMSFGIQHIISNRRVVNGWYYLLAEKLGRRKHLQAPGLQDNPDVNVTDATRIPSINQGVNWMEPHVFVLRKETGSSFGFELTGSGPARVAYIQPGSVAASMGLHTEDCVVRINGHNVSRSGAESTSKIVRGCEKQLIIEIHRPPPKSANHHADDVSFATGCDAILKNSNQPISAAQSQNGAYEDIYEDVRSVQSRPHPYQHIEAVYDTYYRPEMEPMYATTIIKYGLGEKQAMGDNMSVYRTPQSVDDFDVHALSPIVSPDDARVTYGGRKGHKCERPKLEGVSHPNGPSQPIYGRPEKLAYISQWCQDVETLRNPAIPSRHNDEYPQYHEAQIGYQVPAHLDLEIRSPPRHRLYSLDSPSRPSSRLSSRVDRAYESEDCRGMRWKEPHNNRYQGEMGTVSRQHGNRRASRPDHERAYESEDCRGMRRRAQARGAVARDVTTGNDLGIYGSRAPSSVYSGADMYERKSVKSRGVNAMMVDHSALYHPGCDVNPPIRRRKSNEDIHKHSQQQEQHFAFANVEDGDMEMYGEHLQREENHYMPMGQNVMLQMGHPQGKFPHSYQAHKHTQARHNLLPITEEEEELLANQIGLQQTPSKPLQPPQDGGHFGSRVMDLKMAAQQQQMLMDYSPPYMKTKTKRSKAKKETKTGEDKEIVHEIEHDFDQNDAKNKENAAKSKRHYLPIGEEDAKFKSKRVLMPIGEENPTQTQPDKSKCIFALCGGMNTKKRTK